MTIGFAGAVAILLFVSFYFRLPDPRSLRTETSGPQIRILARDGALLAERGMTRPYLPLDAIPPSVVRAVVATEDRRFWTHHGLDPTGLLRAVAVNLTSGRIAQGGSTLTQQLAKNLFLTQDRTWRRKFEEVVLAVWLETRLSKSEILELYLNHVYFGGGAYGVEAAAQRYFGKPADALTLPEAALIAGLLKAPSRYAPTANRRLAIARAHSVLANMREAGFITPKIEQKARAEKLSFANLDLAKERNASDYAIDYVLEQLPPIAVPGQNDLIVETTIEKPLQLAVSGVLTRALKEEGSTADAGEGALVMLDTGGGIRALAGGRSHSESPFNRAVKARRQPGSAFKPFVYFAALEKGYRPESLVKDQPLTLKGWSPKNDNGRYAGPVPLRTALAHSLNTVAVRLMMDVGASRTAALAQRFGISSSLRSDLSLALGTSEVTLLELTGAYAPFANGGNRAPPYIIRQIRSGAGRVLYARPLEAPDRVADPDRIGLMNAMMQAVLTEGTGRRAHLDGHPAGGKTGTSQDFRDAWFIGYTAHYAGGVWLGNDRGEPMRRVTGGQLPARIWHDIMAVAHEGHSPLPLPGLAPVSRSDGWLSMSEAPVSEPLPWQQPAEPTRDRPGG